MNPEYEKRKTWKDAVRHLNKTHRGFFDQIETRIAELNPNSLDRRRFKALLSTAPTDGKLRMSDLVASYHFAKYIMKEVKHLNQVSEDLDFYHLILLADEGIMSDRKPRFSLRLLKRKADKAMRRAGLEGIYRIETSPLINWPQEGKGRTIYGHIHIVGWKRRETVGCTADDVRRDLGYEKRRSSLAFSSRFGADPIEVVHLTDDLGCPSYWAAYIMKAPHDASNLIERRDDDAGSFRAAKFKLMSTTAGYRPEFAMRVFELFGHLPLFAMTGGVGAGAAILMRCRNRLTLWHEQRRSKWVEKGDEWVPAFDEASFWTRTHKRRRARYREFFIDGPTVAQRAIQRRI